MPALLAIAVAFAGLCFAYWWFAGRNQPAFPPMDIADDDPLMLEAVEQARASIPALRRYFAESPEYVWVKLPFVTSSGTLEFVWAELLAITNDDMEVRYMTPPVTHTGHLKRVQRHPIGELRDWLFKKTEGDYQGGFSMRVMFIRGREAWGSLPPDLQAEEAKYAFSRK